MISKMKKSADREKGADRNKRAWTEAKGPRQEWTETKGRGQKQKGADKKTE